MEVINPEKQTGMRCDPRQKSREGRLFTGILILAAGILFLMRELGFLIPEWIFSWQVLLITIGIMISIRHRFRKLSGVVLIIIGTTFFLRDYVPQFNYANLLWPVALILIGLYMLLRKDHGPGHWRRHGAYSGGNQTNVTNEDELTADDMIYANAVFGSVEKIVISKNFRGGQANAVFGGTKIDLSQADIQGTVTMEINSVFGGNQLVVPPHWDVKSELHAVLGGVEDKRHQRPGTQVDPTKVLILKGAAVFGGIEISSY
jgi:predicted membrane protein